MRQPVRASAAAALRRVLRMPLLSLAALPRLGQALTTGAAIAAAGGDLKRWIPRMRVERAHGGSLQDLAAEHRVVVVMTTIPPRIDRIEPVLDSMLAQTWPVAKVYLSIPYTYSRTGEEYVIPPWLESKAGVDILRCEDLGPGTHLLNGLRVELDPWAFLAVVDDDHIYSPELVETLMRAALAHPGSAVAAQGFLSVPGLQIDPDSPRYLHDQGFAAGPVLVSYLGVVYQRGFFDESVFDYEGMASQCRYQDDMWFSAHLAKKGIPRVVLGAALGVQELADMHLGPSSLTFWKENKPREVSTECNKSLLRYYLDLWTFRRRVVLVVAGLPPWSDVAGPTGGAAAGPEWERVLEQLRGLPHSPDLVYLCTDVSGSHARPFGASHAAGGVVVTASNACRAHDEDPGVGRLLRDALKWEGDPNTVIVVGSLGQVAAQGGDLVAATACAARRFSANPATDALDVGEEAGLGTRPADNDGSPFCRVGALAAVCVGAFGG